MEDVLELYIIDAKAAINRLRALMEESKVPHSSTSEEDEENTDPRCLIPHSPPPRIWKILRLPSSKLAVDSPKTP